MAVVRLKNGVKFTCDKNNLIDGKYFITVDIPSQSIENEKLCVNMYGQADFWGNEVTVQAPYILPMVKAIRKWYKKIDLSYKIGQDWHNEMKDIVNKYN